MTLARNPRSPAIARADAASVWETPARHRTHCAHVGGGARNMAPATQGLFQCIMNERELEYTLSAPCHMIDNAAFGLPEDALPIP